MARFNWKAKPTDDPRWRGVQRHYWTLFTAGILIIIPFVILIIVEGRLLDSWLKEDIPQYFPGQWYWRIGLALIPDAILSLIISWCLCTQTWHPIAALATSIALMGLWMGVTVTNPLSVYSHLPGFMHSDDWAKWCYAETAFQAVMTIRYAVMAGFAAKGTHEWRKTRKAGKYRNVELDANQAGNRFEYSHDATRRV